MSTKVLVWLIASWHGILHVGELECSEIRLALKGCKTGGGAMIMNIYVAVQLLLTEPT